MSRPRTTPVRNRALAASIAATGRTYRSIAQTINRVGGESGTAMHCTAASLAKWLNGVTPLPITARAAVEAFSRLLDRPDLTATDLGWPQHTDVRPQNPWQGDPVTWITHLGRDDMLNRRSALTTGLYSLAAATVPTAPQRIAARMGTPRKADPGDVERIRHMGDVFNQLDDRYGGGHARTTVAAFLTQEVAPLLHGTTGKVRPALFTAAAEIAYLLGWMSADDLRTGLAQRYYIQAVRLAEEAGDRLMRSTVLRSLSVQAVELGHSRAGLALAEAAAEGVRRCAPPRKKAWITGMRAEALAASDNNRHGALALLHQAETNLEHADSLPEHEWTGNYRRESFEHQVGLTLTQLGDYKTAEAHYALSLASRRPDERRTRALIGAELAHIQLLRRNPDHAAHTLLGLKNDLNAVASQRLNRTLRTIRKGWRPFRPDPTIDEADRLVAGLVRAGHTSAT